MNVYKNLTKNDVMDAVQEVDKGWTDFYAQPSSFEFHGNTLAFIDQDGNGQTAEFDRTSLGQMYARLANKNVQNDVLATSRTKSIPQFMWENNTIQENMSVVATKYLHRGLDQTYMLRVKNGTLRAFLSEKYTPVSPVFLTQFFLTIPHIRIPNITLSETEMKLNLLTKEYEDKDNLGAGVSLIFDQVGLRSIEIAGMVKRFSCDNSLRVEQPMRFYHTRNVQLSVITRFADFHQQIEQADRLVEQYNNAAETVFTDEDFNNLLDSYRKRMSFSDEFEAAFVKGIEQRQTLQGVIDGFTFAAHTVYPKDLQKQNAFEEFATSLLSQSF